MLRGMLKALPAAKVLFFTVYCTEPLCHKRKTGYTSLGPAMHVLLFFAVNVLHCEAHGTFSDDAAPSHF